MTKRFISNASKLDLWRVDIKEVVDVFTEDDIVQKLRGNKMRPHFPFSNYLAGVSGGGKTSTAFGVAMQHWSIYIVLLEIWRSHRERA
ncbi:hypothetical protein RhiirA4_454973 [Rhizophagus irregularis]|uniref:Uncharacterized protein n=1 Tax=Rhizophagus irregularis TaxID=588596 RepID=A0A2I1G459_9GLOM|nr:hypothetical protein RhiirA4_454973 [Rhizophagus irregularis]